MIAGTTNLRFNVSLWIGVRSIPRSEHHCIANIANPHLKPLPKTVVEAAPVTWQDLITPSHPIPTIPRLVYPVEPNNDV